MKAAERVVKTVLKELSNRKGFDWWWDDLDKDIQQEIRERLISEIDKVIDG